MAQYGTGVVQSLMIQMCSAMKNEKTRNLLSTIFVSILFVTALSGTASAGLIRGTVYDTDTGERVPYATVHAELTGQSMAANEAGEYRLKLKAGSYLLKFSHLAYHSERMPITVGDSVTVRDIYLKRARIVVPGVRVLAGAYGPGQRIILDAIARKAEILARIHSYSFEAYVKVVLRKEGADDSSSIVMITETQHESYWEHPDRYKEIVTAQRQSANLGNIEAYVTVGEMLNFNKSRLDIFGQEVVSPTAEDALDYYNYYLLDTLYVDGHPVFLLEIEPKTQTTALLAGEIMIADSVYDVVGVDVEFNDAFDIEMLEDVRFSRKSELFEDEFWMPVEIRLGCDVEIPIPGIPRLFVDYVAVPHQYHFNFDHPEGTFGEYVFEVAEEAFDLDSSYWNASQLVPLTTEEIGGYKRLDSVAHAPRPLWVKGLTLTGGALAVAVGEPEIFHFNRVEGTYLGAAFELDKLIPRTVLKVASGYAITGEYWQHDYGFTSTLAQRRKLKLNIGYHDKITRRPTVVSSPDDNPTVSAALDKIDPFDYYLEKGFDIGVSTKLLNHVLLTSDYHDYNHYSVPKATEFSLFRESKKHRPNPSIEDGKLRAVSLSLNYDSRMLMKLKGREVKEWTDRYTVLEAGFEYASPSFIDNDFDYRRYYVQLYRSQRTLGIGETRMRFFAGSSDKALPPQRWFTVDFGHGILFGDMSFKTFGESNFSGDRVVMAYVFHDFGKYIFKRSGLPLVKHIPLSLGLFGGVFWTDFRNRRSLSGANTVLVAEKAYNEIGFQIGRVPPLGFQLNFAWQLSDYDTRDFTFSVGMDLFRF
jgi:hypothetical protein